ncbi:hypothetical protein ABH905_004402 [Pseudomonas frederiksbergensis]
MASVECSGNTGLWSINPCLVICIKKNEPIAKRTEKIHMIFTSECYF